MIYSYRRTGHNYETLLSSPRTHHKTATVKMSSHVERFRSLKANQYLTCHFVVWPVILVCLRTCLYISELSAGLIGICFTSRCGFTWNPSPCHSYPRLPVDWGHFCQHPLDVHFSFWLIWWLDNFSASQLKRFPDRIFYRLLLWRSYSFLRLKHRHWWLLTLWCVQKPPCEDVNNIGYFLVSKSVWNTSGRNGKRSSRHSELIKWAAAGNRHLLLFMKTSNHQYVTN